MTQSKVDETSPTLDLPRALVEFILFGPENDRRQLQESPILGDVWLEFGRNPGKRLELLITPYKDRAAATVASVLTGDLKIVNGAIAEGPPVQRLPDRANIAFLQGIVAASLRFDEVLGYVVPMTSWWRDKGGANLLAAFDNQRDQVTSGIQTILEAAGAWFSENESDRDKGLTLMHAQDTRIRYTALSGFILWASEQDPKLAGAADSATRDRISRIVSSVTAGDLTQRFRSVFMVDGVDDLEHREPKAPLVYTISLNRRASHALFRSVPAVKADAARTLFKVDCGEIRWAVLDSGIDSTHPAFNDTKGECRVERILDFTKIRDIVSLNNLRDSPERARRVEALRTAKLKEPIESKDAVELLVSLAQGAKAGRTVNWELVKPFIEIRHDIGDPLPSNHGTHVAGIIGASVEAVKSDAEKQKREPHADAADGMCPDIKLYDVRVLGRTLKETEFAIIAALQYIRHINELYSFITVHGANLSLSIPHDVRNYACGRTPICNECERLVNSGVVVVAAAGNRGYQNFETKEGVYESYAAFSVTDPGNADGVITVGATHRYWPHTYGVSFFSSRGPTGDGRLKPDLVAPGEKIRATMPDGGWGDLDGTSMAAPHVSGAAAMLMARYSELVGQPRRIKDILTRNATDLGRERTFQGNGMLDVLRAFQSI
jgi:serine protease AprX